jgi:hypothetical protein
VLLVKCLKICAKDLVPLVLLALREQWIRMHNSFKAMASRMLWSLLTSLLISYMKILIELLTNLILKNRTLNILIVNSLMQNVNIIK